MHQKAQVAGVKAMIGQAVALMLLVEFGDQALLPDDLVAEAAYTRSIMEEHFPALAEAFEH